MKHALEVEGLSKVFCRDLRRSLWYGIKDLAGELTLRKGRKPELRRDEFWALKEVSFAVERGETLGIVGYNGAGKSTLLKLVSGLIKPDAGAIRFRGRLGALIELGTGFNPVLTGRENVYVNAAVLGLTKREVDARLEEIIEFAEIGEFIDAPVQTYSSGMRVRLGFSVASHINPDVLLIDEILAVGDASFREKSFARLMQLKKRGGTLLFVSHNPSSIESVSDRVLHLEHGQVKALGPAREVVEAYEREARHKADLSAGPGASLADDDAGIRLTSVRCVGLDGEPRERFEFEEPFAIRIEYDAYAEVEQPKFWMYFTKGYGKEPFLTAAMANDGVKLGSVRGAGQVTCRFTAPTLTPGSYDITVGVQRALTRRLGRKHYVEGRRLCTLEIGSDAYMRAFPAAAASKLGVTPPVWTAHDWEHESGA